MNNTDTANRGFTLIEVLLSLGVIAILAGLSIPVAVNFQRSGQLAETALSVRQAYARAQVLSRNQINDTSWGVYADTTGVTIFQGTSYATRNPDYDEITPISGVTVTGVTELTFAQLSGTPSTTGSTTLTNSIGDQILISINEFGVVEVS